MISANGGVAEKTVDNPRVPSWSPDGNSVVYQSTEGGSRNYCRMGDWKAVMSRRQSFGCYAT